MRINNNIPNKVALKDVESGTSFIFNNVIYIKTNSNPFVDIAEYKSCSLCCNLDNGNLLWLHNNNVVQIVYAEVDIKHVVDAEVDIKHTL